MLETSPAGRSTRLRRSCGWLRLGVAAQSCAMLSFEPSRTVLPVMQESMLSRPTVELGSLHELKAPCKNRRHPTGRWLGVTALEELSYRAFICEAVAPGNRPSGRRHWARLRGVLGMWCVCDEGDSEDGGGGGGGGYGSVVRSNAARRRGSAQLGLTAARHGKARAPLVAMMATPGRAAATAGAAMVVTAAVSEEGVAEVATVEGTVGAQGSAAAGGVERRVGRGEEAWRVARGELCVRESWLEASELAALREEVRRLEAGGRFAPSGVATAGRLTRH